MKKIMKIAIFAILSFFLLTTTFVIEGQLKENLAIKTVEVQKQPIEKYNYDPNLPMDGVVDFPDEDFKILLNREYFRQSDDHDITRQQMESLNEVKIYGSLDNDITYSPGKEGFIDDINGIQYAINIKTFSYRYGADHLDLGPLENLVNIKSLTISYTGINDVEPIKNLVNLEDLEINERQENQISNFKVLENLVNLKIIKLSCNGDDENILNYLLPLKKLEYLRIREYKNMISPSISYANESMKYIELYNTKVDDISFLKNLKNIESIEISSSHVNEIPDLSNLTKLSVVNLARNEIIDFSPLGKVMETNPSLICGLNDQNINIKDMNEHDEIPMLSITLIDGEKMNVEFDTGPLIGQRNYHGFFDEDQSNMSSISGEVWYYYWWNGTWVDINNPDINNPISKDVNWLNVALIIWITTIAIVFTTIVVFG